MTDSSSTREISHPIFARVYAALASGSEARGTADHRRRLLAGLAGEVVEIGAGSGLNFAHYPLGVTRVTAVEPESHLRLHAQRAAGGVPVAVDVIAGTAEALPLPDRSYDAAVFSLVLCSVAAQDRALAEARRVLRLGRRAAFLRARPRTPSRWRPRSASRRRNALAADRRRMPPVP